MESYNLGTEGSFPNLLVRKEFEEAHLCHGIPQTSNRQEENCEIAKVL